MFFFLSDLTTLDMHQINVLIAFLLYRKELYSQPRDINLRLLIESTQNLMNKGPINFQIIKFMKMRCTYYYR